MWVLFGGFRGTLLGVPIIRTIVYWGLHWGPLILGNYHLKTRFHGLGFRPQGHMSIAF